MKQHEITISWAGEFVDGRAAIRFNGQPVGFTLSGLETMALLIDAVFGTNSGKACLAESTDKLDTDRACQCVRRVRLDIDPVAGPGTGMKLIKACGRGAYRLTVDRSQITINENIRELVPTHLPKDLVDRILENYQAYHAKAASRQSSHNLT